MNEILHSPAADRNTEPLLEVLTELLPRTGKVLEIASGSGQHAEAFARRFPELTWQPSDVSAPALASIRARREIEPRANLLPPLELDAGHEPWPVSAVDAMVCINLFHISPWSTGCGVLQGASARLSPESRLIVYGPFTFDGLPTAPSNQAFDRQLRERDSRWGLRRAEDLDETAVKHGLTLEAVFRMPANNYVLSFAKRS